MKFIDVNPETWVKDLALQQDNNPAYRLLSFYRRQFKDDFTRSARWETVKTGAFSSIIAKEPTVTDLLPHYFNHWKKKWILYRSETALFAT